MRLLFVCTGNLCRSAVAEGLAFSWARELLGSDCTVSVTSAGTRARPGEPMDPLAAEALRQLGGRARRTSARLLTEEVAMGADLVLTATRDHRTSVLRTAPRAMRRTFLLTEAAHLLPLARLDGLLDLPVESRARELAARLHAARALRSPDQVQEDVDVPDPIGRSALVHREVAVLIADALRPLAEQLFGAAPPLQLAPTAVADLSEADR